MMKSFWHPRKILVISVIICALSVNIHMLVETCISPEKLSVEVFRYEKRFFSLRELLPRHCVAGYVSDDADEEEDGTARLYVARYALSPVILVRSLEHRFIVGNFHNPSAGLELYKKKGLIPFRNFGNGVILFERPSLCQ